MVSHGAITGENVLLSKTDNVKLGAFSLFSFMNERTMNRSLISVNVGECLLAQPAEEDAQKDVWSLVFRAVVARDAGAGFCLLRNASLDTATP